MTNDHRAGVDYLWTRRLAISATNSLTAAGLMSIEGYERAADILTREITKALSQDRPSSRPTEP